MIRQGLNRLALLALYGASLWFLPGHGPFPDQYRQTLWLALGILLAVTSLSDLLTSRISAKLPALALAVWFAVFLVHGVFNTAVLIGLGINGGLLLIALPLSLRCARSTLAAGDWMILMAGAVYLYLAPGFFLMWMGLSLAAVNGFRWTMLRLRLSSASLPFLPFAWFGFLLAGQLGARFPQLLMPFH
ncbi:MAG: hypothetical protein M0Z53_08675 [Thermaerobacter sp.]|nr:hypothetical protein [Thermaerobacter sp.]